MPLRKAVVPALLFLASCGAEEDPTRPDPSDKETPVITDVSPLTPGQQAALRGSNLRGITTLTLDGQAVVPVSSSDAEVQFIVPVSRVCETDGRTVDIVANGSIRTSGRIVAADLVNLQPGESRIVPASELGCVRFLGQPAAYVLSAHNFSRDRVTEPFFRLRTYTTAVDTVATPLPSLNTLAAPATHAREQFFPAEFPGGIAGSAGQDVSAFDPRYATATVGDTLTFVDWSRPEALTAPSREFVPVYRAVVLAVSGQQVVAMDLRAQDAATLAQDAEVRDRFRQAAQIADRYALPSARAVIDPQATYPMGADGRVFVVLGDLPAGISGGITTADLLDTRYSPYVSNIGLINLSAAFAREPGVRPEQVATTVIHETAHLVDLLAGERRGVANAHGWFSEAIAVATEERAARIAVGQEHQVTLAQAQAAGVPAFALRVPDQLSHVYSPWGPVSGAGASGAGAYVRGVRLVLYAMEQLGETGFAPAERSLYQRLLAHSPARGSASQDELAAAWGIDAIARELGITTEALLEEATLAELTDDLVAPEAVTRGALPQYLTWNNELSSGTTLSQRAGAAHWLALDAARVTDVSVPAGAHHYWYLATEPGRGLSVSASQIQMGANHRVRVTRVW